MRPTETEPIAPTSSTRRKLTPLFVPDPGPPGRAFVEDVHPITGAPIVAKKAVESPEAASHWDRRSWRRGTIGV